jgi:hypothetical protein
MAKHRRRRIRKFPKKWTFHHLVPVSRGGSDKAYNLLDIPQNKHNAWHILFGTATLHEIIEYLKTLEV